MRGKKAFWMIILIVISVLSIAFPNVIDASPGTRVYVDPPTTVAETGDYFTISIMIEEVTNLYTWEFYLSWDAEILYTNETMITEGDFLKQGMDLPTTFNTYLWTDYMQVNCALQVQIPASGSGSLAEIQFEVRDAGQVSLELYGTSLRDLSGAPISHTSDSGFFHTTHPRAEFTFSPSPKSPPDFRNPVAGEVVTFNASESYDPDGTIESYEWDFGDGNVTTVTDPIINHTYTAPGTYYVNLTVTDNNAKADTYQKTVTVELHDIAIVNLKLPSNARPGEDVLIEITIANEGTGSEYFNLTVCYENVTDKYPIWYNKTLNQRAYSSPLMWNPVTHDWGVFLGSGESMSVTFVWNTTNVAEGTYTIQANAILVNSTGGEFLIPEFDTADNNKTAPILFSFGVPTAKFTFTPEHPRRDEIVIFNASESYDPNGWIVSYTWDFGDGNTDSGMIVTHAYTVAGIFTVTLTVTDNDTLSATFEHTLKVSIHDVEIRRVTLSKTSVEVGESLSIDVRVRNSGGFDETFNITAYYDGNIIGTRLISELEPRDVAVKTFTWNTTGLSIGTYTISANTSVILYDITPENNFRASEENVTLTAHDIAITDVRPSSASVEVGESLSIDVDITNQGSYNETFDVNLYYDSVLIDTQTGVSLSAGASTTLTFTWNTTGVSEGNYTLKAEVPPVSGETDTADNVLTDGTVTIQAPEQPEPGPEQPGIPLYAIAAIAIVILAAILFYFLKVRKPK